ncbi:MAG: NADH-ubiquinone oxidoreductase-F iron-sulfur binding region domain-containing protein [Caldimonas sp.]
MVAMAAVPVVASVSADELRERIRRSGRLKGRQADDASLAEVGALLGERPAEGWRRDRLIEHLHLLNDAFGGLHERHLVALAHETGVPMAEVYEVASFYHHFDVIVDGAEAPALTVRVCDGLSCEMAGARELLQRLPALLGREVRVIAAPCVGRCEQAPVAVVGQCPVPRADPTGVAAAVQAGRTRHPRAPAGAAFTLPGQVERSVGEGEVGVAPAFVDHAAYRAAGGYALVAALAGGRRSADEVIALLEASGLRGLGGAGFPAGRKWRIVRAEPAPRLVAVNIDEGEPGTFKDRFYLERDPHRFLEGMLIAAWAVGISRIYVYLRDEYHGCRALLEAELAKLRAAPPYPGMPEIVLRRGAGAYICGEESAMIESIEGKRGMPRLRPPYVAQVGLFGRPTLEHNFETLYWVREILEKGADWFSSHGRNGRKGLRSFSVSGRVREPGVKLAPAGITLVELIDEYCGGVLPGHTLYGYLPGGASGGILPASLANVPLDFDTLQAYGSFIGSAAIIVLSDHDTAVGAARNTMRFFEYESCGQCTPCRNGTAKASVLMASPKWDLPLLADLALVMRDSSICGLGQAAPNPIECVVKYFPHELQP